jgi:hypothetical protein
MLNPMRTTNTVLRMVERTATLSVGRAAQAFPG